MIDRPTSTAYEVTLYDDDDDSILSKNTYLSERTAQAVAKAHKGHSTVTALPIQLVPNSPREAAGRNRGDTDTMAKATKKAKKGTSKKVATPKPLPANFTGNAGKVRLSNDDMFIVHSAKSGQTGCGKPTNFISATDEGKIAWTATTSKVTCTRCLKADANGNGAAKAKKPTPITKAKGAKAKAGSRKASSKSAAASSKR